MARLLVHGVPDTPQMWRPLLDALARLSDPAAPAAEIYTPAMPGFVEPAPADFPATMHAYADWLCDVVDRHYAESGPVDLVGHDWGALLALRVTHVRRDRLRSWALINGAFDPLYRGHAIARIWATRGLGELSTMILGARTTRLIMRLCDVPPDLARVEAAAVSPSMKRCIIQLYRSAGGLRDFGGWYDGLDALPRHGLVVWSDRDPFLPVDLAERVAARAGVPLHVERPASHWLPLTHPDMLAARLDRHWKTAPDPHAPGR